jgi:hypothetical protein
MYKSHIFLGAAPAQRQWLRAIPVGAQFFAPAWPAPSVNGYMVCKPRSGDINRVSGENIVALGKAGRAAAAQGHSSPSIVRMPLGMRITTRDLYAQLTPCGDWFRYRNHTLRRLCRPCVWLPYLRRYAAYFAALPLFPTQRAIRLRRPSGCGRKKIAPLLSRLSVLSSQFPGAGAKTSPETSLGLWGLSSEFAHNQ